MTKKVFTFSLKLSKTNTSEEELQDIFKRLPLPIGKFVLEHTHFELKQIRILDNSQLHAQGYVRTEFDDDQAKRMFMGLNEKLKMFAKENQATVNFTTSKIS